METDSSSLVTSFELKAYPNYCLLMSLWSNVSNVEEMAGMLSSYDESLSGLAFVNAEYILHTDQVCVSACQALSHYTNSQLVTRNLACELIYCLSSGRSISHALESFGIAKKACRNILVCQVSQSSCDSTNREEFYKRCLHCVQGECISLDNLESKCQITSLQKEYKMNKIECSLDKTDQLNIILSKIATKDCFK